MILQFAGCSLGDLSSADRQILPAFEVKGLKEGFFSRLSAIWWDRPRWAKVDGSDAGLILNLLVAASESATSHQQTAGTYRLLE